jgi:small subunit ribosomal protein S6
MAQLRSLADAPGTQREYETIFIMRPDSSTDNIQEVNTRIRRIVEAATGKLIRVENWGKRKLAYEIKKELKGIYLYWLYLGAADLVAEIERNLRMLDQVIRYNTVRVDQNVNPEARPTEMDEEAFLAAATTAADEEDTYLGRGQADEFGAEEGEEGGGIGARGEDEPAHEHEKEHEHESATESVSVSVRDEEPGKGEEES